MRKENMEIGVEQFFQDIFFDDKINFNCIHKNSIQINGNYNDNMKHKLTQLNQQHYNIYFVVNSGGYKDEHIKKFNAVFIDLDCGRDSNNNYFHPDEVEQFKKEKLTEIINFKHKFSYIIETRNGFHCYLLLNPGATLEQFIECEERLISLFNADKSVRKPCQLMRVPDFYWCKDVSKYEKFMCTIFERNEIRYDIKEIINSIPSVPVTNVRQKGDTVSNVFVYTVPPKYLAHNISNHISYIFNNDISTLREILKPTHIEFDSYDPIYDYLKQQDLAQFLGVSGKSFKCLFHDDTSPSAGIVINKDTGHQIYCCNSSSCKFKGTIINCVERIQCKTRPDALNLLRSIYSIEIKESNWSKRQKQILDENKRLLLSEELPIYHPQLYKRIKNHIKELYILQDVAKDYVLSENYSDNENNVVFYRGIRKLQNHFNLFSTDKTKQKISLYTYLGLLNKLTKDDVPKEMWDIGKSIKIQNRHKYATTYYSIPSYTINNLLFSEQKANEFKNMHYTYKDFNREMLLRGHGEEEANRVFPQMKNEKISDLNQMTTKNIINVALELINQKGWSTEKEILDNMHMYWRGQDQYKTRQLKLIMSELLTAYGLKKTKLSRDLAKKLDIEVKYSSSGNPRYPIIIYKLDFYKTEECV